MSQQKKTLLKIGAISGIGTPIIAFVFILTAIASYPQFSWANNALSDLGIVVGMTGPVFNFGLYSSGFLAFFFAMFGLYTYLGNSWIGKIGSLTFAATGLALICIGFFPENIALYHYLFSVTFFSLLPISLLVITGAFAFGRQTKMTVFTLLTAVADTTPWVLNFSFHYFHGVAIPEFASAVAGSVWVIVLSYKMLMAASQLKKQ